MDEINKNTVWHHATVTRAKRDKLNSDLGFLKEDRKGHYTKARRGELPEFTGISAPYERPENPELIQDTGNMPLEKCVEEIVAYLTQQGILK